MERIEPARRPASEMQKAALVWKTMAEWFGTAKSAMEWMEAHAGITVNVPRMEVLQQLRFDAQVVRRIEKDPALRTVTHLATLHNTSTCRVRRAFVSNTGRTLGAERAKHNPLPCRSLPTNPWTLRLVC